MDDVETMAERHGRTLARLGELSLALAEDVQAAALATTGPDDKARLAVAFQRVARVVRQSIALEAKLVRDQVRDGREAVARTAADTSAVVETRKRQVRANLERQIVCELDPRDAETWLADLDELLEEEALYDKFLDEPVEAHIARLAKTLDLTGEAIREYIPRAVRARRPAGPYIDYGKLLLPDDDGEDDDEDEADDEDDEDENEDGRATEPDGPIDASPLASALASAPSAVPLTAPAPLAPPDPPPRPPDPEPYIPPWYGSPGGGRRGPGGSWMG